MRPWKSMHVMLNNIRGGSLKGWKSGLKPRSPTSYSCLPFQPPPSPFSVPQQKDSICTHSTWPAKECSLFSSHQPHLVTGEGSFLVKQISSWIGKKLFSNPALGIESFHGGEIQLWVLFMKKVCFEFQQGSSERKIWGHFWKAGLLLEARNHYHGKI